MHFVPSSGRTARLLLPCCSKWESILLVYADPIDLATSTASNEWSPPSMPCEDSGYLMAMNAPRPWEDTSRSNKTSVGQFTQLAPPQTASPGTSHLACCTHVNGNNIDSTLADHPLLSALLGATINPTQPFRWSTSKCLIGFHISTLNTRDNTG